MTTKKAKIYKRASMKDGSVMELYNLNEPPWEKLGLINPWTIFIDGQICGLHFTDKSKAEQWMDDRS